jgi:hypothetical protein
MPEAALLYSWSSTRVKDLAILAMRLASDRSEGSSPRSIQVIYILVVPVHLAGGWFDVHGFGLVGVVPLEQGEHVRLVRGVLVHGLCARWIRGSPRGFRAVRGVRLEVDGRLGDVPSEDVWGDGDLPRRDLGELVRLLVILAGTWLSSMS